MPVGQVPTVGSSLTIFCEVVGWFPGASLPSVEWVFPTDNVFGNDLQGELSV